MQLASFGVVFAKPLRLQSVRPNMHCQHLTQVYQHVVIGYTVHHNHLRGRWVGSDDGLLAELPSHLQSVQGQQLVPVQQCGIDMSTDVMAGAMHYAALGGSS